MRDTVLIVGAGPTGLVLALWLTRQGIKVRIVDKTAGPGTTSRAMAVQARTLELYRQLDLAEAVVEAGHVTPAINLWTSGTRRAHLQFDNVGKDLTPDQARRAWRANASGPCISTFSSIHCANDERSREIWSQAR